MFEVKDRDKFNIMKSKVTSIISFNCADYTDNFLSRRFEVRLRKNNLDSYTEYIRFLEGSAEEKEALKKELTIHVTHFFRDIDFWNVFKDSIIQKIIDEKARTGKSGVKIWSAGCSSGEEPLSIAICFLEALKDKASKFNITIVATDYELTTVQKARTAVYEDVQFQEIPKDLKEKYFTFNEAEGKYTAKDNIRKMITYNVGNILKDRMPDNLDLLFCRNTVIYFNTQAKADLYLKFHEVLNAGGYFIMGKTETLNGPARELFDIENTRERIYRKKRAE